MSSNLKVNNILPSTGDTVAVSGIASITSSVSIASSCTATTFYGSGANLTGITGTTINNNAANRVITGEGGTTLNGEANLTFDGSQLVVKGADTATGSGAAKAMSLRQGDANGEFVNLAFETGASGPIAVISGIADATGVYPNTTGSLSFNTQVGGSIFERLRIFSNGSVGVGDYTSTNLTHAFQALRTSGSTFVTSKNTGGNAVFYAEASSGNTAKLELMQAGVGNFTLEVGGTNALMFKDDGTERLRIASDGDIGVGVASPDGRFHIMGGNLSGAGSVTANSAGDLLVLESNQSDGMSILVANDERANIYFGTTGTNGDVEAGIQYAHENVSTSADRRNMIFRSGGGEKKRIAGNGFTKMSNSGAYNNISGASHEMYSTNVSDYVCRMRCNGNGYGMFIDLNGDTSAREYIEAYSRSANEIKFRVNGSGSVYSRSNVFTSFSDVKLKENIVDANSQWDDIKAIKVRNYNFKKDDPSQKMIGVIAQEVETVSAGLVEDNIDRDPDTNEDLGTTTKSVKYSILYMKAIKCLQEAQARIETLEAEVAALKGS